MDFEARWKNFRGFRDTEWLKFKPLTLLIGPNNTGKTSVTGPLLMMKQTLDSVDESRPLVTQGALFNGGSFENLIYRHQKARDLSFALRFHSHSPDGKKLEKVGAYPPGGIEVSFRADGPEGAISLQEFSVEDIYQRRYLSRTRGSAGRYSLRGAPSMPKGGPYFSSVKNHRPEKFLFTDTEIIRKLLGSPDRHRANEENRTRNKSRPSVKLEPLRVPPSLGEYLRVLSYAERAVETLLDGISYIGPLRDAPRRVYEIHGQNPKSVGSRGEDAPELYYRADKQLRAGVDEWVRRFGFGHSIHAERVGADMFSLVLRREAKSTLINYADTGFGVSQTFPLIVQSLCMPEKETLISEQPEIHLNPKSQCTLADFFVDSVASGRNIIVETHSEHLLLRLRVLVARGAIKANQVALLFVEKKGAESTVREVPIKPGGHIEPEDWPAGFFEDSLREALDLATAQHEQAAE